MQSEELGRVDPLAPAYVKRHRRQLRIFLQFLTTATAITLAIYTISWIQIAQLHSKWRRLHSQAYAAIDRALAGDKQATLPDLSDLDYWLRQEYIDLFNASKKEGQKDLAFSKGVNEAVRQLWEISQRIDGEDYEFLKRDHHTLKTLNDQVMSLSSIVMRLPDIETNMTADVVKDYWQRQWPRNDLDFDIHNPVLTPSEDVTGKLQALRNNLGDASDEYIQALVNGGESIPDFFKHDVSLDPRSMNGSRLIVTSAAESVVTGLAIKLRLEDLESPRRRHLEEEPSHSRVMYL